MATLSTQDIVRGGLVKTYAAADNAGDAFANTGTEYVEVRSSAGAQRTITFVTPQTVDPSVSLAVEDLVRTIEDGETKAFGPFPAGTYTDSATGLVNWTYDSEVGLTVGVFRVVG